MQEVRVNLSHGEKFVFDAGDKRLNSQDLEWGTDGTYHDESTDQRAGPVFKQSDLTIFVCGLLLII